MSCKRKPISNKSSKVLKKQKTTNTINKFYDKFTNVISKDILSAIQKDYSNTDVNQLNFHSKKLIQKSWFSINIQKNNNNISSNNCITNFKYSLFIYNLGAAAGRLHLDCRRLPVRPKGR